MRCEQYGVWQSMASFPSAEGAAEGQSAGRCQTKDSLQSQLSAELVTTVKTLLLDSAALYRENQR